MSIRLIRIGHQQIEVNGQQLLRQLAAFSAAILEKLLKVFFQLRIRPILFFRKRERHGDFLVLWQFLTHVHQGEEYAAFQQEAAVHQWGYTGALPRTLFTLDRAAVRVITAFCHRVGILDHAVFLREM